MYKEACSIRSIAMMTERCQWNRDLDRFFSVSGDSWIVTVGEGYG